LAFLLAGFTGSLLAQTNTGTILGVITDNSAAAVPGANVQITNEGTGVSSAFTTRSDGSYVVPYLLPGTYKVTVSKTGFKTLTRSGIGLLVDQKARLDMTLEVGNINETVQVAGTAPLVETDSSEMGEVITSSKMVELPMNGRDFAQLVSLNAGAVPGKGGLGGPLRRTISWVYPTTTLTDCPYTPTIFRWTACRPTTISMARWR